MTDASFVDRVRGVAALDHPVTQSVYRLLAERRELGQQATEALATGRRAAERRHAVMTALAGHGYEPQLDRRKEIVLANCPFHRLAEQERELVCGMNLDFLTGLLDGMGLGQGLTARLEPAPGYCCVRISAS